MQNNIVINANIEQSRNISASIENNQNLTASGTQRGPQGVPGEAATIGIGTVQTGEAGTDVIITNSGTENAAVFNFTIPRGDRGEQGIQGETGNGIINTEYVSSSGLVDTYHVNYTNGNYDSFTVTNGRDGTGTVNSVNNVLPDSNGNVTLTIPSEVTETTISNWGFTKNTGTVTSVNNVQPVNGNVTLTLPDPLPSQTGKAGLYLQTDGTDASWEAVASRNIGEIVTSTIPLTDAGLHLLDGALIQYGSYQAFVDYIADLYNNTPVENVYNVNIVGSLTNNNGVLSGFSASNYAELPQDWGTFTTLELVIKANISTFEQASNIVAPFYTYTGLELAVDIDRTLVLRVGNGSSWIVNNNSSQLLNLNTDYFFKVTYNSGVYTVDVSIDNESWTNYITASSTQLPTGKILLGQAFVGNGPTQYFLRGSIDLNGCYINIDGQRWWSGKTEKRAGFLTEDEWQQTVTTYGSCGKFVYDSVNNTVRLPKVSDILQGTTDLTAIGDLIEAGLPNITGTFGTCEEVSSHYSGAFSGTTVTGGASGSSTGASLNVTMDASHSNSIYGNSSTVQPQTIKVLYYIVIATTTKTDIQVDIDEIATDLNGKADVDLTNVNNSGTSRGAGWAMPSDKYITLTVGASGTQYTAPANGWFMVRAHCNADSGVALSNRTANFYNIVESHSGWNPQLILPCRKGDIVSTDTSWGNVTFTDLVFFYAQGSESEAQ